MSLKITDKNNTFSFLDDQIPQFSKKNINPLTSSASLASLTSGSAEKAELISKQKITPLSQPATITVQRPTLSVQHPLPAPSSSAHVSKKLKPLSKTYSKLIISDQLNNFLVESYHALVLIS